MSSFKPLHGGAPAFSQGSTWLNFGRCFALLAIYFVLQTVFRIVISDSAELDESEQILWTQQWAWGYGSDPPLYTWLQILFFQVLGIGVPGLAVLKNLLLFSGFVFTYLAAWEISKDERTSVLAALSLILFPQITWESQRDLTHSVLATAIAAATFWLAVRAMRFKTPGTYALLGLGVGLGILSKYSYGLLVVALAVSALSVREIRSAVLNRWILLAMALAAALVIPHLNWTFSSPDLALSRPEELIRESSGRHLRAWAAGIWSLIKCSVMLGGLLVLIHAALFSRRPEAGFEAEVRPFQVWIRRTLLAVLLACLAIIAWFAIELKDRWFQPVVFLGAIAAGLRLRGQVAADEARRFFFLVAGIVVVMLVVLPGIPLAAALTHRPTRLNAPYSALCAELRRRIGEPAVIVADTRLVGGNIRLSFQKSRVIAPEFRTLSIQTNGPWLIVWDATKRTAPSPSLVKLVQDLRGINLSEVETSFVEAPFKYTPVKKQKLGYTLLGEGPVKAAYLRRPPRSEGALALLAN